MNEHRVYITRGTGVVPVNRSNDSLISSLELNPRPFLFLYDVYLFI